MDERVTRLAAAALESRKYAHIAPELAARLTAEEIEKGRKDKEVIKAVRNKLHQVGGAYLGQTPDYANWLEQLSQAEDQPALKRACREMMGEHASTRERLGILEEIYAAVFGLLPPINSVLDVACGLNPLAIPWMPLPPGSRYLACDIYADMTAFLNEAFALLPVDGAARVCDVVAAPPSDDVDLALVMKAIPCLEKIDREAGARLLDGLKARYLAISFPAKSLGGREVGMTATNQARFEALAEGRGWTILGRLDFMTELVFVVENSQDNPGG